MYSHDKETAHKKRELLRAEQDKYVYTEGAKAAALFGSGALVGNFILEKWSPFYHRMRIPFKAFGMAAIVTGAFFAAADRAAVQADHKFAKQYSSVNVDEIERILEARKNRKFNWTSQDIADAMKEHRYKVVGALWGTGMAGTLWYNWRRGDISTSQKIINARMLSQTLALAAFTGFAVASAVQEKEELHDPHYDQVVYGTTDIEKIKQIKQASMIFR
ncbi:hypothetical protein SeMB42_g05572 [Synchytrium endobioticum]|uniref:HIG1 domain-containing protein n=1 Tax=Synchytrium endobioticum TaxID=286115 RepID=A0A507CQN1_9FUNG|nr:hypothetical protein SeMB42_g05572 [Synchytrium endobioticum]TPX51646.1 hypothetical protein SeLEV6574_g00169 [Synchytrium endobioticum]